MRLSVTSLRWTRQWIGRSMDIPTMASRYFQAAMWKECQGPEVIHRPWTPPLRFRRSAIDAEPSLRSGPSRRTRVEFAVSEGGLETFCPRTRTQQIVEVD